MIFSLLETTKNILSSLKIQFMKKMYSFLAGLLMFSGLLLNSNSASAQAVEQGNVTLDAYYGFPNFTTYLIRSFGDEDGTNTKATSLGPIGIKFEYMVSDKVGVGIDYNYTQVGVEWDSYDSSTSVSYHYKTTSKLHRIMPRFNIHFGSSENFDGYFSIGAGYRAKTYTLETNDPDGGDTVPGLNPFAFRIALGGRYYFSDNIGMFMELGLSGGALVHAGLALKF